MFSFEIDDEIELRLHEQWHAEELFELIDDNREHLRPWFPWVEQTTEVADTRDFIRRAKQAYGERRGIPTSIWYRGQIAGTFGIGVQDIDWEVGSAEFGYWLGKRFEGKGIVTRSCESVVEYCFDTLELNRLVIRCTTENTRSRAVAERLDFVHEGTLRQSGKIQWRIGRHGCIRLFGGGTGVVTREHILDPR